MLHGLLLITLSYTRLRLSNVLLFDTILFYNEYLYRPILTNYYNIIIIIIKPYLYTALLL